MQRLPFDHPPRVPLLILIAILVSAFGTVSALSQEGGAAPVEIDDLLMDGEDSLLDGEFHAAIEKFEAVLSRDAKHLDALGGIVECYRLVGDLEKWDAATSRLVAAAPGDVDAANERGEYLAYTGRLDEADKTFRAAISKNPSHYRSHVNLGKLLRYRGKDDDADREFRTLANHAATQEVVEDAERLTWLGHAYWQLGGFEDAAEVFSEAMQDDRLFVGARLALGDLFLDKYQTGDALREYRLGLKVAPNHPDLMFGIARAYFAREQDFSAQKELRRTIEVCPTHTGALTRLAQVELEDRRFDNARERLDGVLEINAVKKEAIALIAAHEYLMNRSEQWEAASARALAIDEGYAGLHLTLAEVLGGLYRFADGLPYAQKAIEMDSELWTAYDVAGRYSFNLGLHEQGKRYLETAQKRDNFRFAWRLNMLEVASVFDEFVAREDGHFKIYIHVDENEVLRGYLTELLEEAYDRLTRRYDIVPVSPTIVEVFPEQDDFAVRNVGATGIDLILGICFGRVFTMNSPNAKPDGFFSWAQTAWHEFAHVITLHITRARIPRWLTEGISVYEERRANPMWERRQEQELLDAYHNDKIFPLLELNGAFRTPRIGFAYYQGSLLTEFIEERWGFDAVREVLKLYGEDMTTPQILLEVLQLSPDRFDEQFLDWVRGKVERFRVIPRWDRDRIEEFNEELELDPDNAELWAKLAWAHYFHGGGVDCEAALGRALENDESQPLANLLRGTLHYDKDRLERAERYLVRGLDGGAEDSFARLRLAQIYEKSGRIDDAVREYKRSKRDFPFYVGPGNAYSRLEVIYRAREKEDEAFGELRSYSELVNTDLESRMKLYAWYKKKGDLARARTYLEELLWVNPFELQIHVNLAEILRETGRRDREAVELRVAIELAEATDVKVDLLRLLAEAELALGRTEDARFHLEEAIRLAPEQTELQRKLDEISSQ